MSWLSEFLHSPIDYISEEPLKALSLLAAPVAAIAAPFALPALGGALGIGAGAGAAGAGGLLGAEAGGLLAGAGGLGAEAGGLFGADAAIASILGEGAATGFGDGALAFASGAGEGVGGAMGSWIPEFGVDALYNGIGAFDVPAAASGGFDTFGPTMEQLLAGGSGAASDIGAAGGAVSGAIDGGAGAVSAAAEPGWWSQLGTGALNSVMKNPLGVALAAGGLGYNMLQGQQTSPEMDAMKAAAQGLGGQGAEMMKYLQTGTLPPGLKAAVDQASAAMKARIVANHARNGQSTNPSQNSALAQELNSVDLNATAMIAQQGQQLLNSGMNAVNMSTQLYGMLENLNRQQSQRMGQAIANFASALNGGGRLGGGQQFQLTPVK